MQFIIYLEVLILTAIFVLVRAILHPIHRFIVSTGAMANFYSKHKIHFWETKKASEILLKQLDERIKAYEAQNKE